MRHMDTGVDREQVVMLPFGGTMDHYGAYQRAVADLPAVNQTATSYFELYSGGYMGALVHLPGIPYKPN